jgi:PAS domain S-box-containing protein
LNHIALLEHLLTMANRPGIDMENHAESSQGRQNSPSVATISSEALLDALIDALDDCAIFTLDPAGRVTSWNSGAQKINGYRPEEIIGSHFSVFYTTEDAAAGKPARELAIAASEGHVEHEGWRVRRDGSRFWASVTITKIRDAYGFAKVTRDMTECLHLTDLEQANALSAQIQTARENEQRRIARELHDDLGQQLAALKIDMTLLDAYMDASDVSGHILSETRAMQGEIDTIIASVRRIAVGLRPPLLDDLGVSAALDWLVNDHSHRYGIKVTAHIEVGDLPLSETASTAIFRIVQEALTNVARHSQASEVNIEVTHADDVCTVRIEDNGSGTMLNAPRKGKSFGLLGIRERVRQLNGTLSIDSAPGCGFRIGIQLPMSALLRTE